MGALDKQLSAFYSEIAKVVATKNQEYGESWKSRGGVGAFMMLARKWDRIENFSKGKGWDIFKAADQSGGGLDELFTVESTMDDIKDLIGYLGLVALEIEARSGIQTQASDFVNDRYSFWGDGPNDPEIKEMAD